MMENKLVSIVIATFNAEKYILDLLDSVKKQTYENLELIIADDCSADNTQNIISDWVTENRGRFFRVELLFAKENQGTCKNYNQAMKRSNGEYIKLVDGDDILLPECIEMLVNECDKKKLDLLIGDIMWVQDDGMTYAEHHEKIEKKQAFYKMDAEHQHR